MPQFYVKSSSWVSLVNILFFSLLISSCSQDILSFKLHAGATCDESKDTEFGGGAGTDSNPYLICSRAQLDLVRTDLAAHYQLMKDIDLGPDEFLPLGDETAVFSGSFNGNGFRIQNWTYNDSAISQRGFFPVLTGKIFSLGLTNINLTVSHLGGGLVAQVESGGVVSHSYVEGVINAKHSVGGIAAITMPNSWIINSYAKITFNTTDDIGDDLLSILGMNFDDHGGVGGLTALYASGNIKDSHSYVQINHSINPGVVQSVGEVVGLDLSSFAGGVGEIENIFYLDQADITDAFAASQISIQGKNSLEMSQASTFLAWDYQRIWKQGTAYPELKFVDGVFYRFWGTVPQECINGSGSFAFAGGLGLSGSPLLISNVTQLRKAASECLGMHAKIQQDLALTTNFAPIEKQAAYLDGGNRTISNWNYNTTYDVGETIFALFKTNLGTIKNLKLEINDVKPVSTDLSVVSGLVGVNQGEILNVSVSVNGTIQGFNDMPNDWRSGNPNFMRIASLIGENRGIVKNTYVRINSSAKLISNYAASIGGAIAESRGQVKALTVDFYGSLFAADPNNDGGNTGGAIGYSGGDDGIIDADSSIVIYSGASLNSNTWNLGGFVGQCSSPLCSGKATISGTFGGTTNYMGGYAGQTWEGNIVNAQATLKSDGVIIGTNYVGALLGRNKTQGHTSGVATVAGILQGDLSRTGWLVGGDDGTGGSVNGTVIEVPGAIVQGNDTTAIPSTVILGEQL